MHWVSKNELNEMFYRLTLLRRKKAAAKRCVRAETFISGVSAAAGKIRLR